MALTKNTLRVGEKREISKKTLGRIKANIPLYIMTLPGIILTVLFCYLPMFGIVIAFKKINLKDGILGSPWVGFSNFDMLLQNKNAWISIRNTVAYNMVFIGCELVFPISLPAIATIALFQTLTYWNDWYNPMLLITNPKLYNLQFLL